MLGFILACMPARRRTSYRFALGDLLVLAAVSLLVLVLGLSSASPSPLPPTAPVSLRVQTARPLRPIPPDFLGLSLEYPALETYAGSAPGHPAPVFVALLRGLAPRGGIVLRIGGDSADSTWWPVNGMTRPPGVTYTLTSRWLAVARGVIAATGARLLAGINLEADSSVLAATEAGKLLDGLGRPSLRAFELGNEPNLYGTFAWYHDAAGRAVPGRPAGYDFSAYLQDFSTVGGSLPSVPLSGPAVIAPTWRGLMSRFLAAEPGVALLTTHRYPLQVCFIPRRSPRYPSIAHLLAPAAAAGLAGVFAPYVQAAHAHGAALRIDELNSVSCGADRAVSQSYASALWAVEVLFELAGEGVDGVNVHTFPGAGYELFRIVSGHGGSWAHVSPEYYGLLMFARAAPAGSKLLPVLGHRPDWLHAWATRAPDGRVRVTVIDSSTRRGAKLTLRVDGLGSAAAWLQRLSGPGPAAQGGVTLGGRTFGVQTRSGMLAPPHLTRVEPLGGGYELDLPPAGAALLTLG